MASTSHASWVVPVLDRAAVNRWRGAWDEVMAGFLPGADGCEAALLAVAEAVCGGAPGRVLDLGGGPGVFAERMAVRWPGAEVGLVDLDPVLLALAAAGTAGRVGVHRADLGAAWSEAVADGGPFDLLTTVMTIHYLPAEQALAFYRAARAALRPGGLLVVADLMPEPGLDGVTARLHPAADEAVAGMAWTRWWDGLRTHEPLRPLMRQRQAILGGRVPAEFTPSVDWHRHAARAAGFGEAGVVWRWGAHAALAAVA
ncbi:class I SAM-dependent methyltransferase [Actinoplanes sp. NEAU-A12]|uniref:Class I SAM-dependent methyltransferase n=1 Tax=Actinoplanes sandaracinus TaxID=3045177 RepID=A0ABT6WPP0_9ACTN|nr:class I SAM-dependent methyltransferase [Actinoplanes sandaracinus]MDI6101693.1 class I SAM-dependent methyltransferase [Actinoplanes sandaracinus]